MKLLLQDPTLLRELCFLDGQWTPADSGRTKPIHNPADGQLVAHVPDMGETETLRAIEGAKTAWPLWRSRSARERSALLRKWHDLVLAHREDLAQIMTAEQGKPLPKPGGNHLRRVIHRMVCRGGQTHLRRHHPLPGAGPSPRCRQTTGGSLCGDHPLGIFPQP